MAPYVFGGMTTLLLLVVLPSLGIAVAQTLDIPQGVGFLVGLLAAFVLSRAVTRWAASRAVR
jgi:hypothetical protein